MIGPCSARLVARCCSPKPTFNASWRRSLAPQAHRVPQIENKEPLYPREYLGIAVDKSSGTNKRSVAQAILKRIEGEIELGEYQRPVAHRANIS